MDINTYKNPDSKDQDFLYVTICPDSGGCCLLLSTFADQEIDNLIVV